MTKQRILSPKVFLIGAMALAASMASAAPLCTTGSMASYLALGPGGCQIGNFLFVFNSYNYTADNTPAPASAVTLTPTGTGTLGDETGFDFAVTGAGNGWIADNAHNGYADVNLAYNVSLIDTSNLAITEGELDTTIAISDDCHTSVGCKDLITGGETIGGPGGNNMNVTYYTSGSYSQEKSLNGTNFSVTKDIFLSALTGGTTQLSGMGQTFEEETVPEPGPFVLCFAGLAALFLFRKRSYLMSILSGLLVVAMVTAGSANASTLCSSLGTPGAQKLSDYLGQTCSVGDILFSFSNSALTESGSATIATPASGIDVNIVNSPGKIGFNFVPLVVTFSGQSEQFGIAFDAQSSSSILGLAGQIAGSNVSTGNVTGEGEVEVAAADVPVSSGSNPILYDLALSHTSGSGVFSPSIAPGTSLNYSTLFTVSGGTNLAHISGDQMTLSEAVPEPVTSALAGGALLGLAVLVRRRTKKA